MIYIAPVCPEAQRRLTTGLASIGWQEQCMFLIQFWKPEQFPYFADQVVISSRLMERHNENLETRFDCFARADKDDIDLWISWHELDTGGSTSQQDNEVDQILTLCTWWERSCTRYGSRLTVSVAAQADCRLVKFAILHEQDCSEHVAIWLY